MNKMELLGRSKKLDCLCHLFCQKLVGKWNTFPFCFFKMTEMTHNCHYFTHIK